MDTKVFEGYVNGQKFTNEEEFTKAVKTVLESGSDNLSVSSRWVYTDTDNVGQTSLIKDDAPIPAIEQKVENNLDLNELVPANNDYTVIPAELKKKLREADNKSAIKEAIRDHIGDVELELNEIDKTIKFYEDENEEYLENIKKNIASINEEKATRKDVSKKLSYYRSLKLVLDQKQGKDISDTVPTVDFNSLGSEFSKFLFNTGFWYL